MNRLFFAAVLGASLPCSGLVFGAATLSFSAGMAAAAAALAVAEDPDPSALFRRANKAFSATEQIKYRVKSTPVGAVAAEQATVDATVHVSRITAQAGDEDAPPAYSILGKAVLPGSTTPSDVKIISTGTKTYAYCDAEKKILVADQTGTPSLVDAQGAYAAIGWLADWPQFVADMIGEDAPEGALTYAGKVAVNGELCHVVHADYSDVGQVEELEGWWYLAESDGLPRRVDLHTYGQGGSGISSILITDLQLIAEPSTEPFGPAADAAFKAPEGYAVEIFQTPEEADADEMAGDMAGEEDEPAAAPGSAAGQPAVDFALKDIAGKPHTLADYRGKVLLLDFWATWCPPCRASMPAMQKLHEELGEKGLAVVGVNTMENGDPVEFKKSRRLTYTSLLKGDELAEKYNLQGIPTFVLINRDGTIDSIHIGWATPIENRLRAAITRALEKPAP